MKSINPKINLFILMASFAFAGIGWETLSIGHLQQPKPVMQWPPILTLLLG